MEKRLIATLATVTLLCSLTGCGNRPSKLSDLYGGSSTNTPSQTTSQNTLSSNTTSAPTSKPANPPTSTQTNTQNSTPQSPKQNNTKPNKDGKLYDIDKVDPDVKAFGEEYEAFVDRYSNS